MTEKVFETEVMEFSKIVVWIFVIHELFFFMWDALTLKGMFFAFICNTDMELKT